MWLAHKQNRARFVRAQAHTHARTQAPTHTRARAHRHTHAHTQRSLYRWLHESKSPFTTMSQVVMPYNWRAMSGVKRMYDVSVVAREPPCGRLPN
jgi:hypothetical protein